MPLEISLNGKSGVMLLKLALTTILHIIDRRQLLKSGLTLSICA